MVFVSSVVFRYSPAKSVQSSYSFSQKFAVELLAVHVHDEPDHLQHFALCAMSDALCTTIRHRFPSHCCPDDVSQYQSCSHALWEVLPSHIDFASAAVLCKHSAVSVSTECISF